ncbi:MFS transporter [Actinoplanes sp. URMC 104]|uniref:MFS transporter n=1 Tax=Actinoplanes sp. URMC 104 TaxID=3423409 RepID=UPI003F1AA6A1
MRYFPENDVHRGSRNGHCGQFRAISAANWGRVVVALRAGRGFVLLTTGFGISQLGDAIFGVGLVVAVYTFSQSTLLAGAVTVARVAPALLAAPLAGILADRHCRFRLLLGADLIQAALMMLCAVTAYTSRSAVGLLILAAVSQAVGAVRPPSLVASLPGLLSADRLGWANGVRAFLTESAFIVGPLLAAALLAAGPPGAIFVANATTFLLSAVTLVAIRDRTAFRPEKQVVDHPSELPLRSAFTAIRQRPGVRGWVVADVLATMVYGALTVLLLTLPGSEYGLAFGAMGVGGMIGAIFGWRRIGGPVEAAIVLVLLAALLPVAAWSLRDGLTLALLVVMAALGALSTTIEVRTDTAMQQGLPAAMLGTATALVLVTDGAAAIVGAQAVAATLGTTSAVAVLACLVAVGSLLVALPLIKRGQR